MCQGTCGPTNPRLAQNNRAFFAFCLDGVLYSAFQAVLMDGAPARLRYTPFFGLAYWLVFPEAAQASDTERV